MKWLKNLFKKPAVKRPEKPQVTIPKVPRITLDDWQANVDNIVAFREFHNKPEFQDMLAVLMTVRPRAGRMGRNAERDLGYIEGYEACLTTIWLMTQIPKDQQTEIVSDFGAEEVQKGWK